MGKFVSTTEAAKILGVSRVTIFNKIKSGQLKAVKVGRNYIILHDEIMNLSKKDIDKAVERAVDEYGETLKLLQNS